MGMLGRKALDMRQQRMNRRFVRADDDAAAAHLLQLLNRGLGLAGESEQALRIILEQSASFGQRAIARGAIEEALAELVLDSAHRLADRGLGTVEPAGRRREAAIRGHGKKRRKVRQLHKSA